MFGKTKEVVVKVVVLGKLPPLRFYRCPLLNKAVPDFHW